MSRYWFTKFTALLTRDFKLDNMIYSKLLKGKAMLITIEGLIGAGKTTLAEHLKNYIQSQGTACHVIPEPTPDSDRWLKRYYEDQDRWAFHTQVSMLLHRYKCYKVAKQMPAESSVIIMDRSIIGDKAFAYAQKMAGYISQDEHDLYTEIYNTLVAGVSIDGIIHVECTPVMGVNSVRERNTSDDEVSGVSITYQRHLLDGLDRVLSENQIPVYTAHRLPFGQAYDDQIARIAEVVDQALKASTLLR